MKKTISLIIAAIMILSALASCASKTASSETSDGASTASLARLPADAVVYVGEEAASHGVDLSCFAEDGYVIRRQGGEVSVFAVSESALDLACRKYERKFASSSDDVDFVHGEGYRVKSVTLAGVDIAEYAIVYPTSLGYAIWDETYSYAAERLAEYIKKTCGAELTVFADGAPGYEHTITFVCDKDAGLGGDGFEIRTSAGQMTLVSAGRGAHFAVSEFLEKYLGWRFLTLETTYLYESEHVDVPAGIADRQVPLFKHRAEYSADHGNYPYDAELRGAEHCIDRKMVGSGTQSYAKYGYGTYFGETNHGYYEYIKSVPWSRQPCLTDPDIVAECSDAIIDEVSRKSASDPEYFEKQGGKHMIRLGENDTNFFCTCKRCTKAHQEEGGYAGLNVRFCNEVEEIVNAEFDGKIIIGTFAYWGAIEPPRKAVPNDNVYVTYCVYQPCWNHVLGDGWCDPANLGVDKLTNEKHLEYLKHWCEISPHVTIYFYGLSVNDDPALLPMHFANLYEDIRLMAEAGARGMMSYACDQSPLLGDLADYILSICMWDPFMSREEYDAKVSEATRLLYGEEVEAINTLLKIYENARNFTPCHVYNEIEMTDVAYLAERADEIERLCDIALSGCESDRQQRDVEKFVSVFLYGVLVGTRDSDWVNGDEASRAVYAARYERCAGYVAKRGLTIGDLAPQ